MLASRSFLCLATFFIATIGLVQAGDGVLSSSAPCITQLTLIDSVNLNFLAILHLSPSTTILGCRL